VNEKGSPVLYHLYLRSDCSLCDAMRHEMEAFSGELLKQTEVRDVDAKPEWIARYGALVPVLETADGEEICHYFLDQEKLRSYISSP